MLLNKEADRTIWKSFCLQGHVDRSHNKSLEIVNKC